MNFTAYIERQKNLIRRRHEEETFLVDSGETFPIPNRDRLLAELDSLRGLNVRERTNCNFRRGA